MQYLCVTLSLWSHLPSTAAPRRRWVHNLHDICSAGRIVFRVKGSVPVSESFILRDELEIRVDPTPPHSCSKYFLGGFACWVHNVFENDGDSADI